MLETKKKESFGVFRWPFKNIPSLNPMQKTNRNTHDLKQVHWVLKDGDHCFNTDRWLSEHMMCECDNSLSVAKRKIQLCHYIGHISISFKPIYMVDAALESYWIRLFMYVPQLCINV